MSVWDGIKSAGSSIGRTVWSGVKHVVQVNIVPPTGRLGPGGQVIIQPGQNPANQSDNAGYGSTAPTSTKTNSNIIPTSNMPLFLIGGLLLFVFFWTPDRSNYGDWD